MKKIVIAAGTGFLGNSIVQYFQNKVKDIVIFTRGNSITKGNIHYIHWNINESSEWRNHLEDADLLINLAGKSVDCRYNETNKAEILHSRIQSTRILNEAILLCKNPPKHFINSSTATIYIHSENKDMNEESGSIGNDFSMNVAQQWEKAFFETETKQTLKTAIRTSIVLGKNGGAFVPIRKLTQFGFGGKQGKGTQFISWIHEFDFCRAIQFIFEEKMEGIVNVVSPKPIRNQEFMKKLRSEMNVPFGISQPKWLLNLGAKIIRTEPELVLKSRKVVPTRLLDAGFAFHFQDVENTFKDLLS